MAAFQLSYLKEMIQSYKFKFYYELSWPYFLRRYYVKCFAFIFHITHAFFNLYDLVQWFSPFLISCCLVLNP